MKLRKTVSRYPLWFLLPALIMYLIFFILPNLIGFGMGFTNWSIESFSNFQFNGLDNFKQMLDEDYLRIALFNTFFFAIFTGLMKNLLGFGFALIVDMKLKLKNYINFVFFLPCTISPLVIAIIFSAMYNPKYGIINTFLRNIGLGFMAKEWLFDVKYALMSVCIMDIWQWAGFSMVIYLAGLQSIPKDYYDAAAIDGASYFQKVRKVVFPLVMPSVTVNVLLTLIGGLKVFGQVYGLTNGGPRDMTQVVGTLIYKTFGMGLFGYSAAMGLIFTVTVSALSFAVMGILRKLEVEY